MITTGNLRRIINLQVNSALARKVLGLYYREGEFYTIPFGPLRGLRMRYEKAVNFHAILGFWERESFSLLGRVLLRSGLVPQDATIADVGANLGMYAMWFARWMVPLGKVYAFEPAPYPLRLLKESLAENTIRNVEVVEAACGSQEGSATFYLASHHHSSSLDQAWASGSEGSADGITVRQTTIDAFFGRESGRPAPDLIKMDIEGGGVFALPGCRNTVRRKRPFILIESHTPNEDRAISDLILAHDYEAYRLTNRQWVGRREETHPAADGVWGTLLLCPREKAGAIRQALA